MAERTCGDCLNCEASPGASVGTCTWWPEEGARLPMWIGLPNPDIGHRVRVHQSANECGAFEPKEPDPGKDGAR